MSKKKVREKNLAVNQNRERTDCGLVGCFLFFPKINVTIQLWSWQYAAVTLCVRWCKFEMKKFGKNLNELCKKDWLTCGDKGYFVQLPEVPPHSAVESREVAVRWCSWPCLVRAELGSPLLKLVRGCCQYLSPEPVLHRHLFWAKSSQADLSMHETACTGLWNGDFTHLAFYFFGACCFLWLN